MSTVSVAMIVKNEEDVLGRILEDASFFADELIVVDTGSTDRTVEIAESHGAKVFHFDWIQDFAAARNESFKHATCDWVMWLDADDRITPEQQQRFKDFKSVLDIYPVDDVDAVALLYRYAWYPDGRCAITLHRERIIRRGTPHTWVGSVHEVIPIPNPRTVLVTDLEIEHRPLPTKNMVPRRNLDILENSYNNGDRTPRTLFYYARELQIFGDHELAVDMFKQYLLAGTYGWEKYLAMIGLGKGYVALKERDLARDTFWRAAAYDSARAEAWVAIGGMLCEEEYFEKAIPFLYAATSCRISPIGISEDAAYGLQPWDYLAMALQRSGRLEESLEICINKLLPGHPEPFKVEQNIQVLRAEIANRANRPVGMPQGRPSNGMA